MEILVFIVVAIFVFLVVAIAIQKEHIRKLEREEEEYTQEEMTEREYESWQRDRDHYPFSRRGLQRLWENAPTKQAYGGRGPEAARRWLQKHRREERELEEREQELKETYDEMTHEEVQEYNNQQQRGTMRKKYATRDAASIRGWLKEHRAQKKQEGEAF